ncbi:MAG: amino acid permease [Planctomycetales bacterium]|nr:amino acid permease [Planctomycetales bacterium]
MSDDIRPNSGLAEHVPRRNFRLFDTVCLIVGIIVGAGIYETTPAVASSVGAPWQVLALWVGGGLISLIGALCYTELAAAYPRDGGDVIYLSRAYGRWAGFLFGWMQLAIVRPGDIAAIAFVFARYVQPLLPVTATGEPSFSSQHIASLAVIVFTLINAWGIRQATRTQNVMTVLKLLGLGTLIVVGLSATSAAATTVPHVPSFPLGVAMVFVLFCYGGWNEIAYIAAEIEEPQRNIWRAMVGGLGLVAVLYLLINLGFLQALGHEGVTQSQQIAVDLVARLSSGVAAGVVAALIAFSALGTLNGQILTGSRISYAAGTEYSLFAKLGFWNDSRQTPHVALGLQLAISLLLINLLKSFDDTVVYTASTVYTFYLASTMSVLVLRYRDPDVPRPYRVIGYPWTILLFAAACIFMCYSTIMYRPQIALRSLGLLLLGVPLYFLSEWMGKRQSRSW